MTRVAYLVPEWPSQTHAFFHRELSALRGLGDTVFLFSTRRPPDDACRHDFAVEARATTHYVFPPRVVTAAAELARRPVGAAKALAYVATLSETSPKGRARLVALLACAADLVARAEELGVEHLHVHSCADAAHLAVMVHLLSPKISYSLTLHGDLPVYGVDHAKKMERAAFVSAVTRPLQKQIVEATSLREARVPVITMGVDTDRFSPPASRSTEEGVLRLLTVARLNPTKGHVHALEAVRRVRAKGLDVRYTIAGSGPHEAEVRAAIAERGLGAAVEMLGSIGEDEVLSRLRASDAFVLSSFGLGEAAPVSVMEAMATGLPVICSLIGGTGDMISDGVDGFLVPQQDEDALADRIERLARDVPLRASIGAAARRRAVDVFDYRKTAKSLHDAIAAARR